MRDDIDHIEELKKQLLALGYHTQQINNFISDSEPDNIIKVLTKQINFAQKCQSTLFEKSEK
ncbi:MAG: hypothetical protein H6Q74_1627 [Firmicutes bacterium]|nr:hypothetical protein [Bacillota bacterium]